MRIILLHYSALPVLGGVEIVLDAQARLLSAAGHDVTVLCQRGGEPTGAVAIERLQARQPGGARESRLAEVRSILAGADVVLMHNVGTMPFDLPLTEALWDLADTMPETRFICWIHDIAAVNPDYLVPATQERPWCLLRRAHPWWEYVAVSDRRAGEWAELCGIPRERIRVIPNGIDPAEVFGLSARLSDLARDLGLWERDLVLLHPARLLRRKNVELGLAVTEALMAEGRNPAYLITAPPDAHNAASAEYAAALRRIRQTYHLEENAYFLHEYGELSKDDLRGLYQLADALFLPSRQEGFGLPLLEAALHRLPAFCADIEPLRSLPGAIPFSLELSPRDLARKILHHLTRCPANSSHKAVLLHFTWTAVYRKCLAPLLATRNNPNHP